MINTNVLNLTNESSLNYPSIMVNQINSYLKFRYILAWINFFIILIGLVCNVISFIAFINPKIRSSTNIFFASLCACSFIALIVIFFKSVMYSTFLYLGNTTGIELVLSLYPYFYPIITTLEFSCIWLTVAVSVNQFLFVAYSKGMRIILSRHFREKENKKAFKKSIIIVLFSAIFCIPYWFKFKYTKRYNLIQTELSKDDAFVTLVHYCMYLPFACVIPFLILIATNIYLIATLKSAIKRKHKLSFSRTLNRDANLKSTDEERKNFKLLNDIRNFSSFKKKPEISNSAAISLDFRNEHRRELRFEGINRSLMLISVVFFFMICKFPSMFLHLYDSIHNESNESIREIDSVDSNYFMYRYYLEVSKLLSVINLSFNFAFFYLFSLKFRQTLRSFFNK